MKEYYPSEQHLAVKVSLTLWQFLPGPSWLSSWLPWPKSNRFLDNRNSSDLPWTQGRFEGDSREISLEVPCPDTVAWLSYVEIWSKPPPSLARSAWAQGRSSGAQGRSARAQERSGWAQGRSAGAQERSARTQGDRLGLKGDPPGPKADHPGPKGYQPGSQGRSARAQGRSSGAQGR